MKDPNIELLNEFFSKIPRQNSYQKWELLKPLNEWENCSVDFQHILFISPFLDNTQNLELPLDSIFGVLAKGDNLYILCQNGLLHTIGITDYSWSMRFPLEEITRMRILLWGCKNWIRKIVHLYLKHGKVG